MRKKNLNMLYKESYRLETLILETQAEIRELKNMMMNHITPNEIRKMMGLPPIYQKRQPNIDTEETDE